MVSNGVPAAPVVLFIALVLLAPKGAGSIDIISWLVIMWTITFAVWVGGYQLRRLLVQSVRM